MRSSKRIISKEEADQYVLPFEVKTFPIMPSEAAQSFVRFYEEKPGSFQINPLIADQSGISNLQKKFIEDQAEQAALEKIKLIQEEAFKEAYQLGLEEGQKQAYVEYQDKLESQISTFQEMLTRIESMKFELLEFNEAHLMKVMHHFAVRLAKREIENQPDVILDVIKDCIRKTQDDENIRIYVSQKDYDYLEEVKTRLSREFDFLKKTTIEVAEQMSPGGCIIETNYGLIDAAVETRVEKMWQAFAEKLPYVKDKLGA